MPRNLYTLSQSQHRDLPEIIARVKGGGANTSATPYQAGQGRYLGLFIELVSESLINGYEIEYAAKIYDRGYGGTALHAANVVAYNLAGFGNSATTQYGRTIVASGSATCGQYTGHDALPKQNASGKPIRYACIGYDYHPTALKWGYLFHAVPDAQVKTS